MPENGIAPISDFANLPLSYGAASYTLAGNRFERIQGIPSIYMINKSSVPTAFPLQSWYDQSARYSAYWQWFNGEVLNQTKMGKDGEVLFRFPLRINSLRDMVRKHASILFGKASDGDAPLVQTKVRARNKLSGKAPEDEANEFAQFCENIVNEVWTQSGGRTIQQEGGELCQFLGGHYYQVIWDPQGHDDWLVPIGIRSWKADFVLPVWEDNNNYQELSEVYIVYRVDAAIAKNTYGFDSAASGLFATYVEWWSKKNYGVYINNEPIDGMVDGKKRKLDNVPNPFGKVPVFYVPHLREGSFFGSSHVPDVAGLIQEYNSSMADISDTIADNLQRIRYLRNTSKRTPVELPGGIPAVDLGMQNPSINNPPDAFTEDPINLSDGLTKHPPAIYQQFRRAAFLPAVAEGEDEGSQRSGVTLDIRFWPATAHADAERSFWEPTLNNIAKFILHVVDIMDLWKELGFEESVPTDFMKQVSVSQNWSTQIPRDRQSLVSELLARLGANGISLENYLEQIGDVENVEEEKALIIEWATLLSTLAKPPDAGQTGGDPLQSSPFNRSMQSVDNS